MKFYLNGTKKDGIFHQNHDKLKHLIDNLFDGDYLISFQRINPMSEQAEYRACYFAKIDMLAAEVGETKYPLHNYIKEEVLAPFLHEQPEYFTHPTASTKYLTEAGWAMFLQRFDLWAFTTYGVILV